MAKADKYKEWVVESKLGTIYVLELAGGNWYVGFTQNLKKRLKAHKKGKASLWTQLHKPVALHATFPGSKITESVVLLDMLLLYPKESVRGAAFCVRAVPPKPRKTNHKAVLVFEKFDPQGALQYFYY